MRAACAMRPSLAARTRTTPLALSATTRFVSMGGTPKGPTKKTTLYKQMAALTQSASTGDLGRTLGVGGADAILADLVRRVFSSRLLPSEAVEKYGLRHIRGILLHGPPGTGKTLVARKVGELLSARRPKLVAGPEIYNHLLGQSEQKIRDLFKQAEDEWRKHREKSPLHVIVIDEIDALCRRRGAESSANAHRDAVVNQLLSKIDGLEAQRNVLIIGTTNRIDMLDEALLRPGRLEVHLSLGLPDAVGREQILNSHVAKLRETGALAEGDGPDDVNMHDLAQNYTTNFSGAELEALVLSATSRATQRLLDAHFEKLNAAAEQIVAEAAATAATARARDGEEVDDDEADAAAAAAAEAAEEADIEMNFDEVISVGRSDFMAALEEVVPNFGGGAAGGWDAVDFGEGDADGSEVLFTADGLPKFVPRFREDYLESVATLRAIASATSATHSASACHTQAVLVTGPPGAGKSTAVANVLRTAGYPLVRVVRADTLACLPHENALAELRRVFNEAYESPLSAIVIRDLDKCMIPAAASALHAKAAEEVENGAGGLTDPNSSAASNLALFLALLRRNPPPGRRLLVLATASAPEPALRASGLLGGGVSAHVRIPGLSRAEMKSTGIPEGLLKSFPEDFPAGEFISSLQIAAYQDGENEASRLFKTRKASARIPPVVTQGKEELQGYIL